MKKRLLAWLLSLAMLLTVGAVAAAETNPNAGLGYYPGTSEKGWISVECSTMSKMNPFLQTYSTEFSVSRHIWDCLVKLSAEDNSIVPAAAESWEKKINSLTLFVFDGSGDAVLQRNFTAAEISGQTATIPVPDAAPGQTYSFYAIANGSALSGIGTLDDLRSQTESEIADYNGTFDEVTTMLHEFGHALHGIFAAGTYPSLTGTAVYRDFVELPSQIMENWAYEKEFLDLFAVDYRTGYDRQQVRLCIPRSRADRFGDCFPCGILGLLFRRRHVAFRRNPKPRVFRGDHASVRSTDFQPYAGSERAEREICQSVLYLRQ